MRIHTNIRGMLEDPTYARVAVFRRGGVGVLRRFTIIQ